MPQCLEDADPRDCPVLEAIKVDQAALDLRFPCAGVIPLAAFRSRNQLTRSTHDRNGWRVAWRVVEFSKGTNAIEGGNNKPYTILVAPRRCLSAATTLVPHHICKLRIFGSPIGNCRFPMEYSRLVWASR